MDLSYFLFSLISWLTDLSPIDYLWVCVCVLMCVLMCQFFPVRPESRVVFAVCPLNSWKIFLKVIEWMKSLFVKLLSVLVHLSFTSVWRVYEFSTELKPTWLFSSVSIWIHQNLQSLTLTWMWIRRHLVCFFLFLSISYWWSCPVICLLNGAFTASQSLRCFWFSEVSFSWLSPRCVHRSEDVSADLPLLSASLHGLHRLMEGSCDLWVTAGGVAGLVDHEAFEVNMEVVLWVMWALSFYLTNR